MTSAAADRLGEMTLGEFAKRMVTSVDDVARELPMARTAPEMFAAIAGTDGLRAVFVGAWLVLFGVFLAVQD